jgi:hypothetical protein
MGSEQQARERAGAEYERVAEGAGLRSGSIQPGDLPSKRYVEEQPPVRVSPGDGAEGLQRAVDLVAALGEASVAQLCAALHARLGEWLYRVPRDGEGDLGVADLHLARQYLADVQMRATRGIAKATGRFVVVDLELDEPPAREFQLAVAIPAGEEGAVEGMGVSVFEKRVTASDGEAALAVARALWPGASDIRLVDEPFEVEAVSTEHVTVVDIESRGYGDVEDSELSGNGETGEGGEAP